MMGQRGVSQDRLFYSFNLDDHVPRSHLLRGIDRFFGTSASYAIISLRSTATRGVLRSPPN